MMWRWRWRWWYEIGSNMYILRMNCSKKRTKKFNYGWDEKWMQKRVKNRIFFSRSVTFYFAYHALLHAQLMHLGNVNTTIRKKEETSINYAVSVKIVDTFYAYRTDTVWGTNDGSCSEKRLQLDNTNWTSDRAKKKEEKHTHTQTKLLKMNEAKIFSMWCSTFALFARQPTQNENEDAHDSSMKHKRLTF